MGQILFENARIFDGRTPELRDGHVLVEDSFIREVSGTPIRASSARRIDLAGRTLMPGLIDAHFHATLTEVDLKRIEAQPASINEQKVRLRLEAALMRGFTTVRDAGGADYGHARATEEGLIDGPRIFFSGRPLSQTGGHADIRGLEEGGVPCGCCAAGSRLAALADGVDAVRAAAREELRRGATQIKIMASGGVASPRDPIWNLQYSEEEIRAIVWEARSWGTYVMAHAYTPDSISRCIEFGVRSIEHGNLIDEATARQAAKAGAIVVPTLVVYDALDAEGRDHGLSDASHAKLQDVRFAGRRSLELLKSCGVSMGFGTDLIGALHPWQPREFAIRAEVLSPEEILLSCTQVNARLLNRPEELGLIAPDARADIIVVDGNPLEDIHLLTRPEETLFAIMKDGRFHRMSL